MKLDYPNLCKSLKVGNLTLRNRMCSAPMGATDIDKDGTPGPRTQGFYEARAKGGAAIVTVSELVVHPETDGSQMLHLNLKNIGQLGAFTYVADAIRRHGSIPSIELSHSGQYAGTYMVDKDGKGDLCQYGPSDGVRPDGMKVKALTKEQIDDIVAAYAEGAALAKRAGFQMCMLHCGHGWLINQFLSPYFNKRTDEYGGSLENRTRLAREVLIAIREKCGKDFPIEIRMSGSELFDGGYDLDEGVRIAQALEDYCDLIHVSAGSYQFGFGITHPSMFREHGCNVYLAAEIKKHVSKPVATLGGLSDPAQMEEIIASGQADLIYMGRALLADHMLPNKVMANKCDEVVKCLRCYVCMAERAMTQTRRCAVNPLIGRELEGYEVIPVSQHRRKRVLVIGGGIAGMVAAITAKQRGHETILCEAEGELGGILRAEWAIPFKHDMYELGVTYARLCEREGVEIRLNTEVGEAYVEAVNPDAVIIAVGSEAVKPPMPVADGAQVLQVDDIYLDGAEVGERVFIMGGGLTGCECALLMASKGKEVHIAQRSPLAKDCNISQRPILLAEIEKAGIHVHQGFRGKEVKADGVLLSNAEGEELFVEADTVVCALGQRSREDVVEQLRYSAPFVRVVGDAVSARTITDATYEAFHAALDI